MATSITLRSVKGSALTHQEVDDNFSNLKTTADAALPSATAATTYQPLDGDLTSIAGLSGTSGLLKKTAANTWSLDTTTYLDTTTAASTYQTQSGMSSYLTTSSASSTYQTLAGMTSYLLSSTATSTYVALAGSTMTGDLSFSGNGRKIKGDFSNATVANRLAFQTSTTDGATVPYIVPNGTGNTAGIAAANASDPTNSSIIRMSVNGSTDARLNADINGIGSYLPMTFYTGGSERIRIDTSGKVGIGVSPSYTLDVANTSGTAARFGPSTGGAVIVSTLARQGIWGAGFEWNGSAFIARDSFSSQIRTDGGVLTFYGDSGLTSGSSFSPTERMRINLTGDVGIGTSAPGYKLDVSGVVKGDSLRAKAANATALFLENTTSAITYTFYSANTAANGFNGFGIYDGSAYRLVIDSSGNVGIGTSSIQGKFNVASGRSFFGANSELYSIGIGYTQTRVNNGHTYYIGATDSATPALVFSNAAGTERMRIDSSGNVLIGNTGGTNKLDVTGSFGRGAPVTKTGNFTLADTENWIICNGTGSITVTLPAASSWTGRELTIKTRAAQTVVSASSNVVPLTSGTAGTAILAATAGKWATLVSDGTNWVIMAGN